MTTVADGLFQYGGMPVGPVIPAFAGGNVFFVRPSTGSNSSDGKAPNKTSSSGPFKTLAKALSMCTAGNGDVVYLVAESNTAASTTDYQSVTLDWNKDGVSLIGINSGSMIAPRSRIAQLSTVVAIDTLFKVSANNCLIANIEIYQGVASSTSTVPVAMEVTGQRNHFVNVNISGMGDVAGSMDVAGGRSLLINGGSENIFRHCCIGLDTVTKATAAAEIELKASATRNIFEDCVVPTFAGAAGFLFVKADAAAAAIDRFVLFSRCKFLNCINSTATTMTAAVAAHATLGGTVVLDNCLSVGATDNTAADTAKVKVLGPTKLGATGAQAIGLAQSADTV